ncbi:CapA family protein [Frateuria defendens]|uniref:CapA family protein n=1 Tax=Frateuria defendens TaxID=2219559 RepID=UPI00066FDB38|nr:CapA family protein [Frateuria defendens]
MKLLLGGDVMTGRGIDQILPHPGDPTLHEPWMRSALNYVALAERVSGAIPRPQPFDYVWGEALAAIAPHAPDWRIVNLETSLTADGQPAAKGIHYRMHPTNVGCLAVAGIDCCVLANNHVADWGPRGLTDTLDTLDAAGLAHAGAGRDAAEAMRPAVLAGTNRQRVLVFAAASPSAGVPQHWAAGPAQAGVWLLPEDDPQAPAAFADAVARWARPGDLVIASLHWGPNWGYAIPEERRRFAEALVERAGVHVVHGHSSHHALGIQVHRGQPLLYGCGDLVNDYEGITGYQAFRPELVLAYLLELDEHTQRLRSLQMLPFRLRRLRLERASGEDLAWLCRRLDRECGRFGGQVEPTSTGTLVLRLPA